MPGVGTSMVRLGMNREELIKLWGEPADEYNHSGACKYSEIHWFPAVEKREQTQGDGVFAFLRDGKVFEVRFGQGFHTPHGLAVNLTLGELKTRTTGKMFELTKSASTFTNDENLYFLIDSRRGVAFEIGTPYRGKQRIVSAIYVFYPESAFLPWGCIDGNQRLVELTNE